jgi:UDP-N-acetylmuramate dehydrogenase
MMAAAHARLRGRLLHDEPMARYTSWRVGGPARTAYVPADLNDLCTFIKTLPEAEPIYWVGLGSNLLVRDGGLNGTVVLTSGALNEISLLSPQVIRAEAGVAAAKLARVSVERGLTGVEFLAGIPGTVGGALAMNAGAFGGETWAAVQAVETVDRAGRVRVREAREFKVSYRHVEGPAGEWFVAGHFALTPGVADEGKGRIKSLLAKRGATQPTQLPNAGSVFKNPPGNFAAKLIESTGLKGVCVGKACVSTLHANFIVNQGSASAADIETLIETIKQKVQAQHGIQLESEVRIVGNPS